MVTATITWDFAPGSHGTIIEYKLSSDTVWIKPTSPANPTLDNEYPIEINESQYYDVRLTSFNATGLCRSITKRIIYNLDGSVCC